jgi:hypothetical protein
MHGQWVIIGRYTTTFTVNICDIDELTYEHTFSLTRHKSSLLSRMFRIVVCSSDIIGYTCGKYMSYKSRVGINVCSNLEETIYFIGSS